MGKFLSSENSVVCAPDGIIPYNQKIWQFGGLSCYRQIKIRQYFILAYTIVFRASAHSQVSAHIPNFKGSLLQLPYKHMEFISQVSTHAGRNRELYLSAHGCLPGTLRYTYGDPLLNRQIFFYNGDLGSNRQI